MASEKKSAVLVILESPGYWLMLKRNRTPNLGLYTPVGGKLEPGESPRVAAIREVKEEAGISLEDVNFSGLLVDSSPQDSNWVCFIYRASVEHFEPPDCEEGQLTWIPIDSLDTLPRPETDSHLYRYILSGRPFFLSAIYSDEDCLVEISEEISGTEPPFYR